MAQVGCSGSKECRRSQLALLEKRKVATMPASCSRMQPVTRRFLMWFEPVQGLLVAAVQPKQDVLKRQGSEVPRGCSACFDLSFLRFLLSIFNSKSERAPDLYSWWKTIKLKYILWTDLICIRALSWYMSRCDYGLYCKHVIIYDKELSTRISPIFPSARPTLASTEQPSWWAFDKIIWC